MKKNEENKPYKPSMSVGEQVFIILYLMLGFFLIFAAEYHIGCWPGRSAGEPLCSEYCYLGFDITPKQDGRTMQQAGELMPCNPFSQQERQ